MEIGLYQGLITLYEYESFTRGDTKVRNGFLKFIAVMSFEISS